MLLPVQIIRKKRDGAELQATEIRAFVDDYTKGAIPDYQMSAFLMAVFYRGMTAKETAALTQAMLESGSKLDLSRVRKAKVDKHSTGGVGDKTSLILAPLLAALDIAVPMIAGRGLGHTGGTVDKLEAIPGIATKLSLDRFAELVGSVGTAMIGQSQEIAPADRKMYALRDVTATVDCVPLIVASIMSKKLAEDFDGVVLDVKCGNGAFMKSPREAKTLAKALSATAKAAGKLCTVLITDMSQPLGRSVGNANEINECMRFLRRGPGDALPEPRLEKLTMELAIEMLLLAAKAKKQKLSRTEALTKIKGALESGRAYAKFLEMVSLQGGDTSALDRGLPMAEIAHAWKAPRAGYLCEFGTEAIGMALVEMGGGRKQTDDTIDHGVGFEFHKALGDAVKKGEVVATIFARSDAQARTAEANLAAAIRIGKSRPRVAKLIQTRLV